MYFICIHLTTSISIITVKKKKTLFELEEEFNDDKRKVGPQGALLVCCLMCRSHGVHGIFISKGMSHKL